MLYKLLSGIDRSVFLPEVISLTDIGPIGVQIQSLGVPVKALGMRRGVPNPMAILKLTHWLLKSKPMLIQTWMYHADLLGGISAKLAGCIPVAWGIRHSNLDLGQNKRSTILIAWLCARLSSWLPSKIVCCSEASHRVHHELGYVDDKMVVIPNGFNLCSFKPNTFSRSDVRQELGVLPDTLLVGLVARFDPLKDHQNFINAAAILHSTHPDIHFLLCGDGINYENSTLSSWIDDANLRERFHLLGRRQDIPRLVAALDIATSSSIGEGFPNVVGEAMSCEVPCVVTDVGDSALIVGGTGRIVPPQDSEALATGLFSLIELSAETRRQLGVAARNRVSDLFSLPVIVKRYEELYLEMISSCAV